MKKVYTIVQLLAAAILLTAQTILTPLLAKATDPLPLHKIRYWAYQIQDLDKQGAIGTLAASPYDMLVVDPTVTYEPDFNARQMVDTLKSSSAHDGVHRKLVLAYLDIGQAEEWRWYWHGQATYEQHGQCRDTYVASLQQAMQWVVACDPDGWAGNYPVAYWDPAWYDIVINGTDLGSALGLHFNSMLDEVLKDGFDGVYLDWVEAWEMEAVRQRAAEEGKNPGLEMFKLIQAIKEFGLRSNPSFIVLQQNSSALLEEIGADGLAAAVDGIAQEAVWWDGDPVDDDWSNPSGFDQPTDTDLTNYYLQRLTAYKNNGFPVFVCEYAVASAADAYSRAAAAGFIGYVTRRPLSELTTTPPFAGGFEHKSEPVIGPAMLLLDGQPESP